MIRHTAPALLLLVLFSGTVLAQNQVMPVTSPDQQRTATAEGQTIRVPDNQTQKELLTIRGHKGDIKSLAWSPDGKLLVSGGADKTINAWEAATGRQLFAIQVQDVVVDVKFTKDGRKLLTPEADKTEREFDAATGKQLAQKKGQ